MGRMTGGFMGRLHALVKTQETFLPAQHSNAQRACERPIMHSTYDLDAVDRNFWPLPSPTTAFADLQTVCRRLNVYGYETDRPFRRCRQITGCYLSLDSVFSIRTWLPVSLVHCIYFAVLQYNLWHNACDNDRWGHNDRTYTFICLVEQFPFRLEWRMFNRYSLVWHFEVRLETDNLS